MIRLQLLDPADIAGNEAASGGCGIKLFQAGRGSARIQLDACREARRAALVMG
jgi:hypothetical protein